MVRQKDVVVVKFIRGHAPYNPNERAGFKAAYAASLVQRGLASYWTADAAPAVTKAMSVPPPPVEVVPPVEVPVAPAAEAPVEAPKLSPYQRRKLAKAMVDADSGAATGED